ncbi:MAG: hypothetical protein LC624_04685, partial [Halobacteriales archaeon]|nr:hypothetical protein [Halobacteriales archaeon]
MLVLQPGVLLNLASGALIGGLGAALLLANPRKDWNRVFAMFACFWGAQIVALNVVRVTNDEAVARFAGEVGLAFAIPLYFFLAAFVAVFPRPRAPLGTSGLAIAALAVPAGLTLAVLFVAPGLLLAELVRAADGTFTLRWGPLLPHLVVAPLYAALGYALFVMMRRMHESQAGIERRQVG